MTPTTAMTATQWLAEVSARIAISEGSRATRYHDSLGIPTIGIGFNLQRADANKLLQLCGSSLAECMQNNALTAEQIEKLFALSFAPIIAQARGSLQATHYDNLSDARRFVICDLVYNLGALGWNAFVGTRALIDAGCHLNAIGMHQGAHTQFALASNHLAASAWAGQVGDRAKRNIAMLRSSDWVSATGDGSS